MEFKPIIANKKQFLELLLLADEQEEMIDKYLERGEMFALYDEGLRTICVVTQEKEDLYEVKNLATYKQYQGLGYGKCMLEYIFEHYKNKCKTMIVGTGDSPLTVPFYERCGFTMSHRIPNFFIEYYDHPIYEAGKQLKDMIYLKKDL